MWRTPHIWAFFRHSHSILCVARAVVNLMDGKPDYVGVLKTGIVGDCKGHGSIEKTTKGGSIQIHFDKLGGVFHLRRARPYQRLIGRPRRVNLGGGEEIALYHLMQMPEGVFQRGFDN